MLATNTLETPRRFFGSCFEGEKRTPVVALTFELMYKLLWLLLVLAGRLQVPAWFLARLIP